MTKTELYEKARNAYIRNRYTDGEHRLNRCKACYYVDEDLEVVALVSYHSLVAVHWRGVVWEFNRWSNTTTQHVRKFARLIGAPVVSLYHCSGMSWRDYYAHESCDWNDTIFEALFL